MIPEREALVRESWARLRPVGDELAARFYERLFELSPEHRRLFAHTDMRAQRGKFLRMMDQLVGALDAPERLVPIAAALATRHVGYGVLPGDYALVGEALVWTIQAELGPLLTPQARLAWQETYLMLAAIMGRAHAGPAGHAP